MDRHRSDNKINFADLEVKAVAAWQGVDPAGLTLDKLKITMAHVEKYVPKKIFVHESLKSDPMFADLSPDNLKHIHFYSGPHKWDQGFIVDGDFFDMYHTSRYEPKKNLHDDMIDALRYAIHPRKLSLWQVIIIKIKMLAYRYLKRKFLCLVVLAIICMLIM